MDSKNFSAKQTAERIGVSRATLSRLCRDGYISFFRVGVRVLFSEQHIVDFLASVERPAHADAPRHRAKAA